MSDLISVLMPTANRPMYLRSAIKCFLSQDYENKELLILDDGTAHLMPIEVDELLALGNVRYITQPQRRTVGAKLNTLCYLADGPILARFDDDDWSRPDRLSSQIKHIEDGYRLTGYNDPLFFDVIQGTAHRYLSDSQHYACGGSFLFTRELHDEFKFEEMCPDGSDNKLLDYVQRWTKGAHDDGVFVARHHNGSMTKRRFVRPYYYSVALDTLPAEFYAAQMEYASL